MYLYKMRAGYIADLMPTWSAIFLNKETRTLNIYYISYMESSDYLSITSVITVMKTH